MALAPVYDVVTTTAYIRADQMALTLGGTTRWPTAKQLLAFGTSRQIGSPSALKAMLESIADGVSEVMAEMRAYIKTHPDFTDIGTRMLGQWEEGIRTSLMS